MAEEPSQTPSSGGADQHWEESENRLWKMHRWRREAGKNLVWLLAGVGLVILLNQLGCPGFIPT